ncbi:MAG: heavy metal translocating P-type ATPase metal-binding domain-containing protein [Bacteroidia bacterium]|nr:heavy metal translocating P-type ATPase metal-binding domain-containing protein [Bacteroidia bacterium]
MNPDVQIDLKCFHCGELCKEDLVHFDDHAFCCPGCKLVYEILSENNLKSYYKYNQFPGLTPKSVESKDKFSFLEEPDVKRKFLQFSDGKTAVVTFFIPQIHCSSCIWLLENLHTLIPTVIRSRVNFIKRTVSITYEENKLSLRDLVRLLAKIGYEPHLDMTDLESRKVKKQNRSSVYRIGIAGFVFGNIMLFSFPEYFHLTEFSGPGFNKVFDYLNLFLSLPVLFYCSSPFFVSAWKSLNQKLINIDVPIALGIAVMFIRSLIEILTGHGPGYLDTMSGLVFFMLLGRAFQDKTYKTISFERDYRSFFPISVMCKKKGLGNEESIAVSKLEKDDHIIIRNSELIPADAIVHKGEANIDYSFVTGESALHRKGEGELIYAGGRHVGSAIELLVMKEVSQSYLTQLWNQDVFNSPDEEKTFQNLVSRISHYFTLAILAIALAGWVWWLVQGDVLKAWNAFTAVLIIACPCALAISSPFTLGNIIRNFGRKNFYLKSVNVIEKLAKIDTIVFDKTGTLTRRDPETVRFIGTPLSVEEQSCIASLVNQSSHPLSRMLYSKLEDKGNLQVESFEEIPGSGLYGRINGLKVHIGSNRFTGGEKGNTRINTTRIYVSINNEQKGFYELFNSYRPGLEKLIADLKAKKYRLLVLSGDNDGELKHLRTVFGEETTLLFNQSPMDKLLAVQTLQNDGKKVLMVGDGLNDAGALKQSNVGISVSDDVNNFSPASDAILAADSFNKLARFLKLAGMSENIIKASFIISLIYNIIGLYFALQGTLSPVIAAILMPISSLSIIFFTTGISNVLTHSKRYS